MEFSVKLTAFKPQVRQVLFYEVRTSVLDSVVRWRKCQERCSCHSMYIGGIKRALETRIKEHRAATRWGETEKSAVVEHFWSQHHLI